MWSAKRVLILIGSLCAILCSFAVYTLFLGVFDSLQKLPVGYLPGIISDSPMQTRPPEDGADLWLLMAFGPGCEEVRRPIRFLVPEKGIVFSAGQFDIEKSDGRVRMAPFSIAMFHKAKNPGGHPEISTIRSDVAYLTLDRPVQTFSELSNRRVIAVELKSGPQGINLTNNRRTKETSDDVEINITQGSLFYEERRNLIWSDGIVRLKDFKTQPPTVINGRAMEMILARDNNPTRLKNAKAPATKNNDNGGIERIILRNDVEMRFWVDSRSGFLIGAQDGKKAPASQALPGSDDRTSPAGKAQIHIKTGGPFTYDLIKEFAFFDSPPARTNSADPKSPDQVHVERSQSADGGLKYDQITCDRFELKFRKKADGEKEIETALATCRPENAVVVASDHERLETYGNFLEYRAGDGGAAGSRTILKGNPLRTVKNGHVMHCKELRLVSANRAGEGQLFDATGPGRIDLIDPKNPSSTPSYPTHIFFHDKLLVVKDKEGGQVFDLMKVYGNASFIDDQQKQELHGEKISVWMLQVQESAKKPQANGSSKQELHRVFAQDRVRASAPEYIIRQTNRLTMTFFPGIARDEVLPEAPRTVVVARPGDPAPKEIVKVVPKEAPKESPKNAGAKDPKQEKPKAPIELEGGEVTMAISTFGSQKQLHELVAKGNVFVHQAGDVPGEKRMDIQGQILTVNQGAKGRIMVVHGESKKKARLEVGDMILWGPRVMVDEGENRAYVDGTGAMEMPSKTNLDGSISKKATTRITIHWNKNMTFDGQYASFHGGVSAHQNDGPSRLLCENMNAKLDRMVHFKEGEKGGQAAKIDKIVCDRKVYIDNIKLDDNKKLAQYDILEGREMTMDNIEGPTFLLGPGRVRTLAPGSSDQGLVPADPKAPAKLVWKLTRVEFQDRMFSNTKADTKNAIFYGDVEVWHFPTTDIQAVMNPANPPKDGLYLRCGVLEVKGQQKDGKTTQIMVAKQNVSFRTDQYVGNADIVTFIEATDTVVFEGIDGNIVRMAQIQNGKEQPMNFNSSRVLYNRKTGKMESEGVKSLGN